MSKLILVNMCILHNPQTGCVLVQDKIHPVWGGISFPGGHVEPGETITASVVREMQEETGLTVENPRLCGVVRWNPPGRAQKVLYLFSASCWQGTLLPGTREGEVRWMNQQELKKQRLAPNMEVFLRLYQEETLTEAYTEQENNAAEQFIFR